jgi:hypothetical protein
MIYLWYIPNRRFHSCIADILAAGTALGRAGEWEAFVKYLKTSYNASQLGQVSVNEADGMISYAVKT